MNLLDKLVYKFNPLNNFYELGKVMDHEIKYINFLIPKDFYPFKNLTERIILLASSCYFLRNFPENKNILPKLFSILIRQTLYSKNKIEDLNI
jgi:hypothetical protein